MPEPVQLVIPRDRGNPNGEPGPAPRPVRIVLDRLAATPGNKARVRRRVRELNQLLEDSGAPIRLVLL
ncbi:MAG: hypothetical protein IT158_07235 [Bryobacterales bacterium]|nr:hypothetical protein [Bryobacterales bacterium]